MLRVVDDKYVEPEANKPFKELIMQVVEALELAEDTDVNFVLLCENETYGHTCSNMTNLGDILMSLECAKTRIVHAEVTGE